VSSSGRCIYNVFVAATATTALAVVSDTSRFFLFGVFASTLQDQDTNDFRESCFGSNTQYFTPYSRVSSMCPQFYFSRMNFCLHSFWSHFHNWNAGIKRDYQSSNHDDWIDSLLINFSTIWNNILCFCLFRSITIQIVQHFSLGCFPTIIFDGLFKLLEGPSIISPKDPLKEEYPSHHSHLRITTSSYLHTECIQVIFWQIFVNLYFIFYFFATLFLWILLVHYYIQIIVFMIIFVINNKLFNIIIIIISKTKGEQVKASRNPRFTVWVT